MADYKLVPVEPTAHMLQAACDEEQRPLPMWSRMKAIYTAMLAAAPAVQGEPVAWLAGEVCGGDASHNTVNVELDNPAPWSALPIGARVAIRPMQPAEQRPAPDLAGLIVLLEHAQCPNCDGSGARHDNYGEPEQCQWCCERDAALAAHCKQGGDQS